MIGLSVDIVPVDPVALLVPRDADDSYPAIRPSEGLLSLERAPIGALVGPSARGQDLSRRHQEARRCVLLAGEDTDRLSDR